MSKPTLLLIDDEERILRSLRMLFFSGYNVRMTTDPYEAIKILRDERVHVVVSDQRMPVMQGSELCASPARPHPPPCVSCSPAIPIWMPPSPA